MRVTFLEACSTLSRYEVVNELHNVKGIHNEAQGFITQRYEAVMKAPLRNAWRFGRVMKPLRSAAS